MNYNQMKIIVKTIDELKSLSFKTLDEAKDWAKLLCCVVWNTDNRLSFNFEYGCVAGKFFDWEDGRIELCDVIVYDENGEPVEDFEL